MSTSERISEGQVSRSSAGFTMLEVLISTVIVSFVLLAIYKVFDQANWLYLHSEKRSNMQESGRMVMEQLERDFRMIGVGVPLSVEVGGSGLWVPWVWYASPTIIAFRGDMDNQHVQLTANAADNAGSLSVEDDSCASTDIVIIRKRRRWQGVTSSTYSSGSMNISPNTGRAYLAKETEVFTPEHVFYRYVASTDYPFGTIDRCELSGNTPLTNADPFTLCSSSEIQELARNVVAFDLDYFQLNGTELTGSPLSALDLSLVDRITITMTMRERAQKRPGQWQEMSFFSEAALRNRKLN